MSNKLTLAADGSLLVPLDKLGKLKGLDPENFRIASLYEDLLITQYPQPGERSRPLLYGDLRLFHVAELMALISSMRKDGTLMLWVPHARKTIFFAGGEIVYASSSVEDDRLGEVLWRRGMISLKQLSEVYDQVTPKKKLGALLVEKKYISPRQLYDGIATQVREIVFSTFYFSKGEFVFVEGKSVLKSSVRLDITTKELIMEGLKRVEEMSRLEESFPDRTAVLIKRPMAVDAKLEESEKHLIQLVNGKHSVDQIIEKSHLGEFEALRALSRMRQLGLIESLEAKSEESPEEQPLSDMLESYAKLLRQIHQTLKVEIPGSESRLEAYLGTPSPKHEGLFLNVGFDADGRLDVETLYRNAKEEVPDNPREKALEALKGLYDYALFQASDVLDSKSSEKLLERIKNIRQRMEK